jgi:hypothetical protein
MLILKPTKVETKPEPTQRARHLHEMCEQLSKLGQVPIDTIYP